MTSGRWRALPLALAGAIAAICILLAVDPLTAVRFTGVDFISYWSAWVAVGRGLNPYDADVLRTIAAQRGFPAAFPFLYPPPLAVLASPLGALEPWQAWRMWTFVSALAAGIAGAWVVEGIGESAGVAQRERALRAGLTIALLFVLDARNGILLGQIDLLVLGGIASALALRLRRPAVAGGALAVAALVKITPALLALLLVVPARGRRRFLVGAGATAVGIAALSLLAGGLGPWQAFLSSAPHVAPGATPPGLFPPAVPWNLSLAGWMARSGIDADRIGMLSGLVTLGWCAPIAWLAFRATRRGAVDQGEMLEWLALPSLVVMVVCSPFAYVHHLVFLLPGAAWTLSRTTSLPLALALLLALATSAVDFPLIYPRLGWANGSALSSLNLYALFVTWVLSLAGAWRGLEPRGGAPRLQVAHARTPSARRRRA